MTVTAAYCTAIRWNPHQREHLGCLPLQLRGSFTWTLIAARLHPLALPEPSLGIESSSSIGATGERTAVFRNTTTYTARCLNAEEPISYMYTVTSTARP
jgi:hypothetical protein